MSDHPVYWLVLVTYMLMLALLAFSAEPAQAGGAAAARAGANDPMA